MTKKQISLLRPIEDVLSFWDVLTPDERNFIQNTYTLHKYKKNEVMEES